MKGRKEGQREKKGREGDFGGCRREEGRKRGEREEKRGRGRDEPEEEEE